MAKGGIDMFPTQSASRKGMDDMAWKGFGVAPPFIAKQGPSIVIRGLASDMVQPIDGTWSSYHSSLREYKATVCGMVHRLGLEVPSEFTWIDIFYVTRRNMNKRVVNFLTCFNETDLSTVWTLSVGEDRVCSSCSNNDIIKHIRAIWHIKFSSSIW